eukprot:54810-Lingulodinium_polyedra.AAC.1
MRQRAGLRAGLSAEVRRGKALLGAVLLAAWAQLAAWAEPGPRRRPVRRAASRGALLLAARAH